MVLALNAFLSPKAFALEFISIGDFGYAPAQSVRFPFYPMLYAAPPIIAYTELIPTKE